MPRFRKTPSAGGSAFPAARPAFFHLDCKSDLEGCPQTGGCQFATPLLSRARVGEGDPFGFQIQVGRSFPRARRRGLAQNKARRHVTQAQLGLAVTAVYAWKPAGNPAFSKSGSDCPIAKTNAELAQIAGVSERTIKQAKAVQGGEHQCDSALFPQDVLKWRQFPTFSGLCYKKMGEQSGIGEQVGAKIESHPEKS
mgnify:CR=1 FL=1